FLLLPARERRLTPLRVAAAGLSFGFAVSIRPDAVLYIVPGTLLLGLRWYRERPELGRTATLLASGALALLVGGSPFLAYNWKAADSRRGRRGGREMGSVRATEPPPAETGGERVGYASAPWHGGSVAAVQGGGLRIQNLPAVLPQNIGEFRQSYGDVLLLLAVV